MTDNSSRIKSLIDADNSPEKKYQRWREEISMAEKEFEEFHRKGRDTVRRFKDERDAIDNAERKYNIFTANVTILQSSLYAKIPKVSVGRRFGQQMDDVARVASMMLQNCIMQDIDEPECDFDQVMKDAIEDRLVPGMGTAWLRLETDTEERELEEQSDPLTGEVIQEAATYEAITRQEVIIEHVFWEDFLYSPCRTWKERRWVGRKVYMDQDALVERFGEDKGKRIALDYNPKTSTENSNEPQNEILQKAIIYEIWDRQKREVVWLSKGFPELLDEKPDPLHLEDFEPCPKPLFALTTTSNCIPTNDFVLFQDQYNELDQVNNRISLLVSACKVVGVYDSSSTGIQRMLQQGTENTLVPVDNWAMFAEKGGIKGVVDWLPLDMVIAALERLRQAREDIKGQIYELTGISDIVRGDTKASETLGAQKLKAGFASVQIQKKQDEVARFAQDVLRIKGEIICRHVEPEQMLQMSNMMFYMDGQNAPLIHQAIQLLKGDHEQFEWRVNVQADSMAMVDYASQKQEKVELINAVATFLQSAATTLKAVPPAAPMLFQVLKFAISGFKGSQEMEGVIDQGIDAIMKDLQEQKAKAENTPPPEVIKAQTDMKTAQQKAQMDQQSKQQELAIKQQEAQLNAQVRQTEAQMNAQTEQTKLGMKQQEHEMDMAFKVQEHQMDMQQNSEKFDQQLALNEAKARQQMVADARQDNEKGE